MKRKILIKKRMYYAAAFSLIILLSAVNYVNSAAAIKSFSPDASKSGVLRTDNSIYLGEYTAGDTYGNMGRRVFLTFDISEISPGVSIDSVKLDLTHYSISGDPFHDLGTFYVDGIDYGNTLNTSDYYLGANPIIATYSSPPSSPLQNTTLKNYVTNALSSGKVQFRLRFLKNTDNDGALDGIYFNTITLTIGWSTPPPSPTFTVAPTFTYVPLHLPDLTVSDIFTH
ncbi:MAG TPA: hypothetical protein ENG20_00080, partial [Methanomicrobia archaeon]|nr:hypothetical protein [Methanomicrobia archaeon]